MVYVDNDDGVVYRRTYLGPLTRRTAADRGDVIFKSAHVKKTSNDLTATRISLPDLD